jgi:cytosine/uracil/thiamine/allantoin permease
MKQIANFLMPFAAIVLVVTCLISIFSLFVVVDTSVGLANGVPWGYYQRLNIGVISVALPVVGMILFGVIFYGLREKTVKAAKPAVIETLHKEKKEEDQLKAAA